MKAFQELLLESIEQHGHLFAGKVIGVRMAMLGCRLIGIEDPKATSSRKKLIVFVEIDRCATDAIQSVTGCRLGKLTLKFKDYGINAATFVNIETNTAFRILSKESAREQCKIFAPDEHTHASQQVEGYKKIPDETLFDIQKVRVKLPDWEMPGPPRRHAVCSRCDQVIRDGKEHREGSEIICGPCSHECYFDVILQSNDVGNIEKQKELRI